MPTGYTAGVEDGSVLDVKQFLKQCARAFGAFVSQRDESLDVSPKVPDIDVSYEVRALAEARGRAATLKGWDGDRIEKEHRSYEKKVRLDNEQMAIDWKSKKRRLESMLGKVDEWNANDQATTIKNFAISQLEQALEMDCGQEPYQIPVEQDPLKWFAQEEEAAERTASYYERAVKERLEIQLGNAAYAQAVLDSIEGIY